jgi:endoglucanase
MNVRLLVLGGSFLAAACAEPEELSPSAFHPRFDAGSTNVTIGTGGSSATSTSVGTTEATGGGPSTTATTATTAMATTSGGGSSGTGSGGSGGAGMDASTDARGGSGNGGSTGPGTGGSTGSGGGPVSGFSVLYANMQTAAMSAYIGCELHAKNSAMGSLAVSELKLRYYYTNEVTSAPQLMQNWSHVSTGGAQGALSVTFTVNPLMPPASTADTYLEFSLSSADHPNLAPGESADFSWQMQGPDPSRNKYTQTNDYSWDATKTSAQPWEHVVLLRNGFVIWGSPP